MDEKDWLSWGSAQDLSLTYSYPQLRQVNLEYRRGWVKTHNPYIGVHKCFYERLKAYSHPLPKGGPRDQPSNPIVLMLGYHRCRDELEVDG